MSRSNLSLLTPPQEKEEVYPYRRVWRSLVLEAGGLSILVFGLYLLVGLLGIDVPDRFSLVGAVAFALLPFGLWVFFSWRMEQRVLQPRQRLLAVAVISGLVANAVGIPLIEGYLQVDRWLPLAGAINRIIGYTFTVGIVQEILKYLVVRHVAWQDCFRIRLDGVAYGIASAVGYAAVMNLHFVLSNTSAPWDIVGARVLDNYAVHIVGGMVVGYGLSEVRFGLPTPIFQATTLALASFLTGVFIAVRAGLLNPSFSLDIVVPRALFGLAFSVVFIAAVSVAVAFLYNSAERRDREAAEE